MFSLFVKFWSDVTNPESTIQKIGIEVNGFSSFLKNAYEKAESAGCLIDELACQYISFCYLQAGRLNEAREAVEKLCDGKLSEAVSLWLLRISIELKCLASKTSSMCKEDLNYIFKILERVLNKLSLSKSEDLCPVGGATWDLYFRCTWLIGDLRNKIF
ncbi:hypothetical protein KSP40_PGU003870 [Platanthera guangdongensis]|uniref:Uncharacterized protein n=1 Tax=Platanthera guangdongensis TaxID=2320717 RepID=A0ABR2MYR4_9ASPA